jgi:hypothetical protein
MDAPRRRRRLAFFTGAAFLATAFFGAAFYKD